MIRRSRREVLKGILAGVVGGVAASTLKETVEAEPIVETPHAAPLDAMGTPDPGINFGSSSHVPMGTGDMSFLRRGDPDYWIETADPDRPVGVWTYKGGTP